jgi:hypothetical protein
MFDYDELPLVIHNGVKAALISGKAEVEYDRDGDWSVGRDWGPGAVLVEGYGEVDVTTGKRQWPYVPAPKELADIIVHRLENEWAPRVQEAVNEMIEHDYECEADDAADAKRDRLMER